MQLLNRSTVYSVVDALLLLSRIIMHFVLISFPVNGPGDTHTARRADRREALIHFSSMHFRGSNIFLLRPLTLIK